MIDEQERYEQAFHRFPIPEPSWDRFVHRRERRRRNQRIAASLVAVAVFLVPIWIVVAGGSPTDADRSAELGQTDPTAPAEPGGTSESFAESFMTAWAAGDVEVMTRMLGPDGRVSIGQIATSTELETGSAPAVDEVATLPALHDWYRAVGSEFRTEGCFRDPRANLHPFGPAEEAVRAFACPYTYQNDLTRAFGREPIGDALYVSNGGEAPTVFGEGLIEAYADISFEFREWISTEHPADLGRMYRYDPYQPRLDRSSIATWEARVDEFVASLTSGGPPPDGPLASAEFGARARTICAAAWTRFETALEVLDVPEGGMDLSPAVHAAIVRVSERALDELRALPLPAADREHLEDVFALIEREIDIDRELALAAEEGDADRVEELTWERIDTTHQKDRLGGPDFWWCPVSLGA